MKSLLNYINETWRQDARVKSNSTTEKFNDIIDDIKHVFGDDRHGRLYNHMRVHFTTVKPNGEFNCDEYITSFCDVYPRLKYLYDFGTYGCYDGDGDYEDLPNFNLKNGAVMIGFITISKLQQNELRDKLEENGFTNIKQKEDRVYVLIHEDIDIKMLYEVVKPILDIH